jgi:sec-independent protein translocase protein TatA
MFGSIGYQEVLVIGVVAILLFGKRLPEVARTWGNSYRDLRRSLNEIKTSFSVDGYDAPKSRRPSIEYDDRVSDSGPRFIPPADDSDLSAEQGNRTPPADDSSDAR